MRTGYLGEKFRELYIQKTSDNPIIMIGLETPIEKKLLLSIAWCDKNTGKAEKKLDVILNMINDIEEWENV